MNGKAVKKLRKIANGEVAGKVRPALAAAVEYSKGLEERIEDLESRLTSHDVWRNAGLRARLRWLFVGR